MKQNCKLSIVVITRNRVSKLTRLLEALYPQLDQNCMVIVVDNNSDDDTREAVLRIKHENPTALKYIFVEKVGYASARNAGLRTAKSDWIAFLDDDCIPNKRWYQSALNAISKFPRINVFVGKNKTRLSKNVFSLSRNFLEYWGRSQRIRGTKVLDFEVLDTKNIIYQRAFLKKNQIKFREEELRGRSDASEDCDIGMQIQASGGKAAYLKEMQILHEDSPLFHTYITKIISAMPPHLAYEARWRKFRKTLPHSIFSYGNFLSTFKNFSRENKISSSLALLTFINILFTALIIKICRIIYKAEHKFLLQ